MSPVVVQLNRIEWAHAAKIGIDRAGHRLTSADSKHYTAKVENDVIGHIAAAVTEYAVAKLTDRAWIAGSAWPVEVHDLVKHLPDVGNGTSSRIEVKRITQLHYKWFPVDEHNKNDTIFVTHVDLDKWLNVSVLGWAKGDAALREASVRTETGCSRMMAPISMLNTGGLKVGASV